MKELVGKKIQGVFVNEDQSLLVFHTDQGVMAYRAKGDCCSETWFADITGAKDISGSVNVVEKVEELLMPDCVAKLYAEDGRTRQEYDQVYGYRITAAKWPHAQMDIVYRNSSNGYYGGWCDWVDAPTEDEMDTPLTAIVTNEWRA